MNFLAKVHKDKNLKRIKLKREKLERELKKVATEYKRELPKAMKRAKPKINTRRIKTSIKKKRRY